MAMAFLQLYQNPHMAPNYGSISAFGNVMECTPVGMGLRTGKIRVAKDMADFLSCNYLSIERGGRTIYGWITDVAYLNDNVYEVSYDIDPLRTYKDNIDFGSQFVVRTSTPTNIFDPQLGSHQAYPDVSSTLNTPLNADTRVFVVQVRPSTGENYSKTPAQPSPYQFFLCEYQSNNWTAADPIRELLTTLEGAAEPQNLVTMYSIPYFDLSNMSDFTLTVDLGDTSANVPGWKMLEGGTYPDEYNWRLQKTTLIDFGTMDFNALTRVPHVVTLVIPDAGVMNIPDGILAKGNLFLQQEIDLFSGASSYMLTTESGELFGQSLRGSSTASIPILSDPMDTYLSQNQNALVTSLIGDVAMIGGGVAVGLGVPGLGSVVGAEAAVEGVGGLMDMAGQYLDASNQVPVNPPAFLGTAMANNYNNVFWVVIQQKHVDNADTVHSEMGYPLNEMTPMTFPAPGEYIQTKGCGVDSDGTVPLWAIQEINRMFDQGVEHNA